MAYQSALSQLMSSGIGAPPAKRHIGTPSVPAAQGHIEPPPYDVAMDPGWKGILDPHDHELRNVLNDLSPEQRQLLLTRLGKTVAPSMPPLAAAPPAPGM